MSKVKINSDELTSIVSLLAKGYASCTKLSDSVSSNFSALNELGIFMDGISNISSNLKAVGDSTNSIGSAISSHLETLEETESYGRQTFGDRDKGTSKPTDDSVTYGEVYSGQVGITSLDGVILTKNDCELFEIDYEDYVKVRSNILYKINNDTPRISEFNDNVISPTYVYLANIAKESDLSVYDLVFNDANASVLLKSIKNVYEGNVNTLDEKVVENLKNFLLQIAQKLNITVDELLSNEKYINELRGF